NKFQEAGYKIALERRIPAYNRAVGSPIGQDQMVRGIISGTSFELEPDQLNMINNRALMDLHDDVLRTSIYNLDVPHHVVQIRANKEVTPESVNEFLRTYSHNIGGGASLLDKLDEIDPNLTKDGYVKVLTGADDVKDMVDSRFIIDIDKNFHESRAKKIKQALGENIYVVARTPTVLKGIAPVWSGMQACLALQSTYRMTTNSTLAEHAFTTKNQDRILLAGETGQIKNIPYGIIADLCQGDAELPAKPFLEVAQDLELSRKYLDQTLGCLNVIAPVLLEQFWMDQQVLGGFGYGTQMLMALIIGEAYDEFLSMTNEIIHKFFTRILAKGQKQVPKKWKSIRWVVENVVITALEKIEKYYTVLEYFSANQFTFMLSCLGGNVAALLTGSSKIGDWALAYTRAIILREGWLRTGTAGFDMPAHIDMGTSCSLRFEEGGLAELQGMRSPFNARIPGYATAKASIAYSAALGRGDPWVVSPFVKAAFSDPHLKFNFKNPKESLMKGAEEARK
ncbi:MAG: coenzyme-B sulfoethylthiotransferase subunit alpha, partial [Candidatus Helarchaeales archaeon]